MDSSFADVAEVDYIEMSKREDLHWANGSLQMSALDIPQLGSLLVLEIVFTIPPVPLLLNSSISIFINNCHIAFFLLEFRELHEKLSWHLFSAR